MILTCPTPKVGRVATYAFQIRSGVRFHCPIPNWSRDSSKTCKGLGWGNAMEEMLLNAHLAYLSNRTCALSTSSPSLAAHVISSFSQSGSYVFENYTWDKTVSGDISSFNGKKIPARVPLTALLSGASPFLSYVMCAPHFTLQPQAQLQEIPFRHLRIRHPRSYPSFSIKYALTVLSSSLKRSMARYGMNLPRPYCERGLTDLIRRRIGVSRSRSIQDRFSI